ncbi:BNR repeat-containing protein [Patescibacteria group bacterium]|nr:BNR repeat-containing protein [Patescibacteria group bacterium]
MWKFLGKILHSPRYISAFFLVFILLCFLYFNSKNSQSVCAVEELSPVASSAIFEWFQKPAAIRFVGKYDRTYIAWINSDGKIQIRYHDNKENKFSPIYTVDDLYREFGIEAQDDHNAPSLLILPDGRILIFYTVHDANGAFFMKQSTTIEDISSWTVRKNIDDPGSVMPYNYPQAKRLSNGNILLFYRRGNYYNSDEYLKVSKDNGTTWEKPTQLIDFSSDGVYALVFVKGDAIHITWNESLVKPPRKNIYYMYSPDGGVAWEKKDGTLLTLPVTRNSAEVVFDSKDDPDYVWDIVADNENNPFIVFAYKKDPSHEFRFAQWDGGSWTTNTITTSAQLYGNDNFYSGGIVIDPRNVHNVYLSKKREQLEIERWASYDGGRTWQQAEVITNNSTVDNFRMQLVENYSDALRIVWASGIYEGLINGQWMGFSKVDIQSDITKQAIPNKNCSP